MGKVGHFGKIKFYAKTGKKGRPKMQYFGEMTWNTSINISEHKRIGKKPLVEVTSKNLDEISMAIYFLAEYAFKTALLQPGRRGLPALHWRQACWQFRVYYYRYFKRYESLL